VSVHRQRLWAFTLSGAICGFAGGLLVHQLGTITAEGVYLDLTFLTLAMLVVGGAGSLLGAVVGALLVSGLDSFLVNAENGVHVVGFSFDVPSGSSLVVLGALMALILVLRPAGLTGGKEARFPRFGRGRPRDTRPATGGTT
jgi:branched-chain amino acid transport system permease protein